MPYKRQDKGRGSLESKAMGSLGYITQPATNVAVVKGQVVVSPTFTYKRRLY
tara:strand:+ start:565 stop:720 length:156 start_codon:yes stop_codon:yes gene_type:complete